MTRERRNGLIRDIILILIGLFIISMIAMKGQAQVPRPYVAVGGSLMPAGYYSVAYRIQGGFLWDTKFTVSELAAAYDDGHKDNDATLNNVSGHDRYLAGFLGYRYKDAYFAGGARWSQLSTINYIKGLNLEQALAQGDFHPQFGFGYDYHDLPFFSTRIQLMYVLPPLHESVSYPGSACAGCGNGLQGPEVTLTFPSPKYAKHFMYRMVLGVYEYHSTITDPNNKTLTAAQDSSRHVTATTDFIVLWRF